MSPPSQRTWALPYGQVTIDLDARTASWSCWRPGSEGELEQDLDALLASGPPEPVSRALAKELLAFVGRERAPWFDPAARLTVRVGGAEVTLHAYPPPGPWQGGLDASIARVSMDPAAFFERYGLMSGELAEEAEIGGVTFARDTPVSFHRSGRVSAGTTARPAVVAGRAVQAGARVMLDEAGNITFVSGP